jgi:hypothetical protein
VIFDGERVRTLRKEDLERHDGNVALPVVKTLDLAPTGASRGTCVERSLLKPDDATNDKSGQMGISVPIAHLAKVWLYEV